MTAANSEEFTMQARRTNEHKKTYNIVKLRVFPQSSVCRNMNSAGWAFIVAFPEAFLDTIATEAMKTCWINVRIGAVIQTRDTRPRPSPETSVTPELYVRCRYRQR